MTPDHYLQPPLSAIPADLVSASDYERYALERMSHNIAEYITSGSSDDLTLVRNRQALDALELRPQVLQRFSNPGTRVQLGADTLSWPLLLAPVAYQQLVHEQGEMATAQAAQALDTPMIISSLSSCRLEDICARHPGQCWFQLYWQENRERSLALLRRAEDAGCKAVVVTVDAPVSGMRNRPQRAGFRLPAGVAAVNLLGLPPLPARSLAPQDSVILHGLMGDAPDWDDIVWLMQQTQLPLWIKGIMNPDDAARAVALGVHGIVVSNHGGRSLDGLPATARVLPAVRQATGADYPVLFDSGIRRGSDIVKALALGANAVLLGRPQLYALSVAGALGVAHLLRTLREELEITLALCGCPQAADIGPHLLFNPYSAV